jgi:hypothetical protein
MTPQERFVTRLRRHRQRCQLSLEALAIETHVKVELLEALERNDLSAWPKGLYARAWIRAYATAVGLDPNDAINEFCRLFPHGDRRAGATIQEIAAIVASPSGYRDESDHPERRRRATDGGPRQTWSAVMAKVARQAWARVASLRPSPLKAPRTPQARG